MDNYNFFHDNHHLGTCTGTSTCPYLYDDDHRRYYHDSASHEYVLDHDDYIVNDHDDYIVNDHDYDTPDYYVVTDDDILVYDNGAVHVYNNDEYDHGAAHHNNDGAPDHLFNLFHDEFDKHYNHNNDDNRVAAAIDHVNEHDYDHVVVLNDDGTEYHAPARCECGRYNPCRHHERPDDYIDNFYDDFYFDHFHDGACDEHLVNKHHNYD